jgi:alpha-beta hydrolase superfamily lysophospholipase
MQNSDGRLTVGTDTEIYYQCWEPDTAPRGLIVVVHGMAEHGGRYDRFATAAVQHGYAVAALDQPGHGRSSGSNAHVARFDDFQRALQAFHKELAARFSGIPHFLLGHSLGGLISATYLLQHQAEFAGCVLSGPAIKTDIKPPALQMLVIRLLSLLMPRFGVLQLDANGVSRTPAEVERYCADPLVYNGKISARVVAELFVAMDSVQQRAGEITLPMLLLHGGDDAMASPEGSRFLDEHMGSSDKTLHIYPGLYHEIFNEPERDTIFSELLSWCDAHAPSPL